MVESLYVVNKKKKKNHNFNPTTVFLNKEKNLYKVFSV